MNHKSDSMNLSGRKVLITGGSSGLGLEISRLLIKKGAEVYAMGRQLHQSYSPAEKYSFIKCDFSDLKGIKERLAEIRSQGIRFDLIINNAGVLTPPDFKATSDGVEYSFQVNFLANLLVDQFVIKNGCYNPNLRILAVTSPVYRHVKPRYILPEKSGYRPFRIYSESKYYVLLIGQFLKSSFPANRFSFIGFNPGTFGSGIYRMQDSWFRLLYKIATPFMRRPEKVAEEICKVIELNDPGFNEVYSIGGKVRQFFPDESDHVSGFLEKCRVIIDSIV